MLKTRASNFTATVAMVAAVLIAGGAANAVTNSPGPCNHLIGRSRPGRRIDAGIG
jgi:hypothetical protein